MTVDARNRRFRCPSCGADYRGAPARCPFDASVLEEVAESLVGSTVGDLVVVEPIGSGAVSTVYSARRHSDEGAPTLAVKVLRPDLAEDPTHRARFLREARATMRVRHEGVVVTHRTSADDETPTYLVMDLLRGDSLARRIDVLGKLPVREARRIAGQVASALAAAHASGVVHRDVKPANVMLGADGRVVVVDFGLACSAGEVGVTSTGELVGTPHFMAPEQILGRPPIPAVDAYAVGCVLHAMVHGAPPFTGTSGAVLDAHLESEAPPLSSGDAELDAWTRALLSKRPEARMGAFGELAGGRPAS